MNPTPAIVLATALAALGASTAFAAEPARSPTEPGAAPAAAAAPVTTLSPEQRAALRARLAELLRQDSEGLRSALHADGAVSLELDGRYQHAIVARPTAGGRPELACFDDPDRALAFLARDDQRATPTAPADAPPPGRHR